MAKLKHGPQRSNRSIEALFSTEQNRPFPRAVVDFLLPHLNSSSLPKGEANPSYIAFGSPGGGAGPPRAVSTGLQQPERHSYLVHILPPDCGSDLAPLSLSFVICEMSTINPHAGLCVLCMLSCFSLVQLFMTLWTVAHQAPLSMGFSR